MSRQMSVMVSMAIRWVNLLKKNRYVNASNPHWLRMQFWFRLLRFLIILCNALITRNTLESFPMVKSIPYFKSQIFNLFNSYHKILQQIMAAIMTVTSSQKSEAMNQPTDMRLSETLRVALDVVKLLFDILFIQYGVKNENTRTHHREEEGTREETHRIRINGKALRVSQEETYFERMEGKSKDLLQRPCKRKRDRKSNCAKSGRGAINTGKAYDPSDNKRRFAEPSQKIPVTKQVISNLYALILISVNRHLCQDIKIQQLRSVLYYSLQIIPFKQMGVVPNVRRRWRITRRRIVRFIYFRLNL